MPEMLGSFLRGFLGWLIWERLLSGSLGSTFTAVGLLVCFLTFTMCVGLSCSKSLGASLSHGLNNVQVIWTGLLIAVWLWWLLVRIPE